MTVEIRVDSHSGDVMRKGERAKATRRSRLLHARRLRPEVPVGGSCGQHAARMPRGVRLPDLLSADPEHLRQRSEAFAFGVHPHPRVHVGRYREARMAQDSGYDL